MNRGSTQPHSAIDQSKLAQIIGGLTGQTIQALAIVVTVDHDSLVNSYLSARFASPRFRHAIDMERAYSDSLIGFDDAIPPFYDKPVAIDLTRVAQELGVDRVLCFVSMSTEDSVSGTRDYDGAEVTLIETAMNQLSALHTHLDNLAGSSSTGKIQ